MQILALETDVEVLKKKFLVEGEQAALVTHKHWIVFFVHTWWQTMLTALLFVGLVFALSAGLPGMSFIVIGFGVWLLLYAHYLLSGYVQWKYNFIIVTTQKIVIVDHYSLFRQHINPLPFPRISNTRVESQLAGIVGCGILYLNMTIPERQGQYTELAISYLPKPADIAAVIENGITLEKQPPKHEEEQEKKTLMQQPVVDSGNPEPETLAEQQPKQEPADSMKAIGQIIAAESPPPDIDITAKKE
jgi:hypothetical protein